MSDQMNHMSSSSSGSDRSDGGEWLEVDAEEETLTVVSLLDSQSFASLAEMLAHCKLDHGFDLVDNIRRLQLDFHGAVKLVNFIRSHVQQKQALPAQISHNHIEDDRYLKPVLENDAVIFSLDEILEADQAIGGSVRDNADASTEALLTRNRELEAELESTRSHFASYRLAVQETLDRRWGDDVEPASNGSIANKDPSDYYFESYAANEIHETMLKDSVRTDAYRDFIYGNKHLFKDKVVLDIGCGTGILSMFCAKAGAKLVIAVDKSDIIVKAMENIFNNGLSDTITCLRGAIEDVTLPVDKVDIIVSEWMGYCLLYEAMLPSVLYARDRYLKPDGLLAPSSATLWIAPVGDPEYTSDHISYWRDVYGFDMKAMQEGIYEDVRVQTTPKRVVCGEAFPFKVIDLRTVRAEDLLFTAEWESVLTQQVDELDGFLIWFDNFFATSPDEPAPVPHTTPEEFVQKKSGNVAFTTGPCGTETHWQQGLLLVSPSQEAAKMLPPSKISGKVTFGVPEENARALKIKASWSVADQGERAQSWSLK